MTSYAGPQAADPNNPNRKAPQLDPEIFMLDLQRNINEFQVQDIRISLDDCKVFEIKCNTIPISALPAGAREPRLDTEFDKINPQSKNLESLMANYKGRIAGVMLSRDPEQIQKIETQMALNKNDMQLKQDYEACLKKCVCLELVQIKDFYQTRSEEDDNQIQSSDGVPLGGRVISKQIEVRTTRGSFAAADNRLSSSILFIG